MRADASYVYVADDAGFSLWRNARKARWITRIGHPNGKAIAVHTPDLVVIACNTASTLALTELRERFSVPFVGNALWWDQACMRSRYPSGFWSWATAGNCWPRVYACADPRKFAAAVTCTWLRLPRLAGYAEAELAGAAVADSVTMQKSLVASSMRTDGAPTRLCWPARTIHCCLSVSECRTMAQIWPRPRAGDRPSGLRLDA